MENQTTQTKEGMEVSDRIYKLLTLLVSGLLLFLLVTLYINNKNTPGNYPREINVSATGKTAVIPDVATIVLGVTSEGATVADVTVENTEKMNNIIKEMKALKIDEKDIKTTRYNLRPEYDWTEEGKKFLGYRLDQEITVKIRDFEKIGDALDKATASGANIIQDIRFEVDDIETVKQEALEEAVQKAKAKAKSLARASDLKLGKLVTVYEEPVSSVPQQYALMEEGVGRGGGGETAPEIQPGEQEITVRVNLVYRVR